MSMLNRRNALTAFAGLPAIAIPAVASAAAGPDPIFARIAEHRAAWKKFSALCTLLGEAQDAADDTRAGDEPRVVVGEQRELHTSFKTLKDGTSVYRSKYGKKTGGFYYARNIAEIERSAPKANREAWIAERAAMLEADAAEIARAKEECGLAALEAENHAASNYADEIAWRLIDNPPVTIAGAAALLAYAAEFVQSGSEWPDRRDDEDRPTEGWSSDLHESLARVLSAAALKLQS
jgi:hypothetical protein